MMNLLLTRITVVASMLAFAPACSSSDSAREGEAIAQENQVAPQTEGAATSKRSSGEIKMHLQKNCPMSADDVDVDFGLTSTGTTISFTTESGNVADLRRRVRHLGEVYGAYDGEMEMGWYSPKTARAVEDGAEDKDGDRRAATPLGPMPVVSIAVVERDKGAQIVFTPTEPEHLDEIQVHTANHHKHLAVGHCWMPKSAAPTRSAPATPIKEVGN